MTKKRKVDGGEGAVRPPTKSKKKTPPAAAAAAPSVVPPSPLPEGDADWGDDSGAAAGDADESGFFDPAPVVVPVVGDVRFTEDEDPLRAQCIFMMKTMQMSAIKTVFGAMKDILIESAMVIRPNGISITNMDKTHCIYVNMFLEGDKFQEYFCNADKIAVGINLIHFFRVISIMSPDDTLTLYILKTDYEDGIISRIGVKIENASIRKSSEFSMKTQDLELDDMDMPHARFSSVITMPSTDFQKIIKDLKLLISDRVVIRSVDDQLLFVGKGNIFDSKVSRAECEDTMGFIVKPKEGTVIQGVFSINHLLLFTKCTSLCSQIELYFENDLPLIVNYKVSTLGSIGLCATPLEPESTDPL